MYFDLLQTQRKLLTMKLYKNSRTFFAENEVSDFEVVIVGAGLSGSVLAEQFAHYTDKRILMVDKRNHLAGNCYDYVDENGIRINKYGAHLFHTNYDRVWHYVNRFEEWKRWEHKVLANVDGQFVPVPVNITTVNTICGENIQNEEEMDTWLAKTQVKYDNITNSREMALSRVGPVLYEKMIMNYTIKQWSRKPEELSPEVLRRIPIRNNFDDRYFTDRYQALPRNGYTQFFHKLLHSDQITVALNLNYFQIKDDISCDKLVYTGPIDHYYSHLGFEPLKYRSLRFVTERYKNCNFYQPNSVVNYPGLDHKFTRIVEYKHFLNQPSDHTTIVKEYGQDGGEPYYPILDDCNKQLYQTYQQRAEADEGVLFVGRLANYKYFNMDEAIHNALLTFEDKVLPSLGNVLPVSIFLPA